MLEILRGIVTVIVIMIVAGLIAYIGDRVGHQVGRRRLTLFGLRPKYTSTIVAVGTGMLIALGVTGIAIGSSHQVQDAFFRIDSLTSRIQQLQAQADALENKTRNGELVIPRDTPLQYRFLVLHPTDSRNYQMKVLSAYFDDTVNVANQVFTQNPYNLRPFPYRSTDHDVSNKLRAELDDTGIQRNLRTGNSILLLAVFPENLYRGDRISFEFVTFQDRFIFAKDQIVAALDYLGGNVPDLGRLITLGQLEAIKAGMPGPFTQFPQIVPAASVQNAETQVLHGKGVYRVTLLAARESYAHDGTAGMAFHLAVAKVGAR
ncbi:MAG: DUF3084 domain-containing protein [Candidatus Eremiobacteraeota bacterium]|nr:DUF3084 domain-containing protein [Candidatus Eremiobacteraeota bacterium]MBV8424073.1 DUF3084 domain-containing protein [Candidatus Eremiobacteraeota bacterium]